MDIVAISPRDMIDFYAKWFKEKYISDYIDYIASEEEKINATIEIESGRLTYLNYQDMISILSRLKT